MERLNPFIKSVAILLMGLIISFSHSTLMNGTLILIGMLLLLFFSKAKLSSIIKIFLPATLAAVSLFFTALFHTNEGSSVQTLSDTLNFGVLSYSIHSFTNAVELSMRIYAYAVLGMLFGLTTGAEDFIYSLMHQCRLSPKFAYGILAALHIVPVIKIEYHNVLFAYRVRGCKVTPVSLKPVFSMLVNTMHWSENIAMAMESKGFEGEGARTYYKKMVIHWYDIVFLFITVIGLFIGVLIGS